MLENLEKEILLGIFNRKKNNQNILLNSNKRKNNKRIPVAEKILKNFNIKIGAKHCLGKFVEKTDTIKIKSINRFISSDFYYYVAFHEIGHWTGSKKNLNRPSLKNYIISPNFNHEEIVAEIFSYLIMKKINILSNEIENYFFYNLHGMFFAFTKDEYDDEGIIKYTPKIIKDVEEAYKFFVSEKCNDIPELTKTLEICS